MTSFIVQPAQRPLIGHVQVPGDKSIAHRALLFGSLASGEVRVSGIGAGGDNRRSARAMTALGARLHADGDDLIIRGTGLDGLDPPEAGIDCGNSGTTMRLLCGLLAGQSFETTLSGDDSLSARPMRRVIDPLGEMGAAITGRSEGDNVYPPLHVAPATGLLHAIDYALPMASAQVKSAILLAGLYADGKTIVREPGPSRDHTERMLAHMGAPIATASAGVIELDPAGWDRSLACGHIAVPADPSQAAFVLCAALLAGVERVTVGDVCINPTRTGFLDVLAEMGALIERQAMTTSRAEPTADLSVSRGAGDQLTQATIRGDTVVRAIDELPILAVVAASASGVTEIRDAAELRVKESDRIATTCEMLRALGVEVEERPDGLSIAGLAGKPFTSARIHAHGDHRIAMSAAVAGLAATGPVRIDGAECVDTSFPQFVATLRALGAEIAIERDTVMH